MMIDGKNIMTTEERHEIIELLVKAGFYRSMLLACDNKALAAKLRQYRQEQAS